MRIRNEKKKIVIIYRWYDNIYRKINRMCKKKLLGLYKNKFYLINVRIRIFYIRIYGIYIIMEKNR